MAGKSYRDLETWQRAMDLVEEVYAATKKFPKEELFGLSSQLRRAVVSVPSNIAEGQGHDSAKEFLHHLAIAYGSLCEAETQILIAARLSYLERSETTKLISRVREVGRLLNGLLRSLRKSLSDGVAAAPDAQTAVVDDQQPTTDNRQPTTCEES